MNTALGANALRAARSAERADRCGILDRTNIGAGGAGEVGPSVFSVTIRQRVLAQHLRNWQAQYFRCLMPFLKESALLEEYSRVELLCYMGQ